MATVVIATMSTTRTLTSNASLVDDVLRRLVRTLRPNPAYVINPWWDLLVYNDAYAALLGGLDDRPPTERNSALRENSPRFTELWEEHTVRRFEASRKRFRHPDVGRLDLDYVKLATADDDRQQLVVFLPADDASAAKLTGLR